MITTAYHITPVIWFMHDAPADDGLRTDYHIQSGDYFPMLATILGFIEESLIACAEKNPSLQQTPLALVRRMRKDLTNLNSRYRLEKK